MLCAVSPFGMSRIKRTQVRAAFCFSFFCFFRSTHVNQNTAAFFIIRYTYRLRAKCLPFTHAKNTRTQKDNSILRYSPRAVKPRAVSLCTEFGHTAEGSIPIFSRFLCSVRRFFKKRPLFSSILYGKLLFGAFISCFFRKILTFWNFLLKSIPIWCIFISLRKEYAYPNRSTPNAFSVPSQKTLSERY